MKRTVVILLALILLPLQVTAAKECDICRVLSEKGFPEDYREPLCALTILHPQWNFEPLFVTELSREKGKEYDFSYVVASETASGRSLVTGAVGFEAYRDGEAVFDTGYFDATREAVAYFLDPRNFLSEKGIFQFLLVTGDTFSADGIKEMLRGSAAEAEEIAEALASAAEKTGLDPLFLATRLRQEQGADGSPLLDGTAGSVLSYWYERGVESENGKWIASPGTGYDPKALKALDGYFNPFHAFASGEGAFEVYFSGASHAKEQGWDSLEKGLLGGAEKLRREYVDTFQNTLYLQKWNVDIRSVTEDGGSRNFWGQYMQNIGAAKTEGDRLFESYEASGRADGALSFSIPVYEGMGEENPDPAEGACLVFAAEELPESSHLYLQEVLSPEKTPATTVESKEEKEKKEPFLWGAAILGSAAVCFAAWRLAWTRSDKKQRNIRHFHQKK